MNHYKIVFQPINELPQVVMEYQTPGRFNSRMFKDLLRTLESLALDRRLKDYYVYILKNERVCEVLKVYGWAYEVDLYRHYTGTYIGTHRIGR